MNTKKTNILTQRVDKLANGLKLSNQKINELQLEVARLKRKDKKMYIVLKNLPDEIQANPEIIAITDDIDRANGIFEDVEMRWNELVELIEFTGVYFTKTKQTLIARKQIKIEKLITKENEQ
jgi:hypothetical protein